MLMCGHLPPLPAHGGNLDELESHSLNPSFVGRFLRGHSFETLSVLRGHGLWPFFFAVTSAALNSSSPCLCPDAAGQLCTAQSSKSAQKS